MKSRFTHDDGEEIPRESGIGTFLRGLLTNIPWSECAEREEHMQLAAPSAGCVRINNANGRTRVIGEDRSDIEATIVKHARAESDEAVEWLLDEIRVNSSEEEGTLRLDVEIPRKWNRHGNAHLEVRMPRGTRVGVTASNGKVCVEGMRNAVAAQSSNGSVRVSDVVGDIKVTTSNAKVSCARTCGRLLARSSNGKIELDDHKGSVDASTSNGLIHASLDELGHEGVVLTTSNGRIVLELPEDVDADVDMRVDNGRIRSLRDLSQSGAESQGRMRGRLGHGGAPIKLRTSNGTISLR